VRASVSVIVEFDNDVLCLCFVIFGVGVGRTCCYDTSSFFMFFWVGIGSIFIVWILFNLNESLLSFLCDTIFNLRVMLKLHYLIIRAYEIASSWVARYNITLDVYSLLFGYFMVANYLFLIG
jgi:hypothetical protein